MKRILYPSFGFSLLVFFVGCAEPETADISDAEPAAVTQEVDEAEDDHDHADHDHEHGDHDHGEHADSAEHDETAEALASLTDEERQSVLEQEICPVTEKPLGSMGTPKPVDVAGETIWICCEGCEKKVRESPEKYLAKLAKAKAKAKAKE